MNPIIIKCMVTLLSDFLSSTGITVEFNLNLKYHKRNGNYTIDKFVTDSLGLGISPDSFFESAFNFADSPQGKDFWLRHSHNWAIILSEVIMVSGGINVKKQSSLP